MNAAAVVRLTSSSGDTETLPYMLKNLVALIALKDDGDGKLWAQARSTSHNLLGFYISCWFFTKSQKYSYTFPRV